MKLNVFARVRQGLLVLAASVGLVFGVSTAPAHAAETVYYVSIVEIRANHSGMCLEVADWSTANGAAVRQWPCTGGANQKWYRAYKSGTPVDAYFYVNVNSGKCMEIGGWKTNNGAPANQWDCHYGLNQLFYGSVGLNMDFWYARQNMCLEIADWSTQAGAPARLWTCTGGANQRFDLRIV
ncbi:RICIN domain-containing protein [Streptomyces sp. NBC_01264]|uniref:RICIN domain-containing protein n=1 Tax=Streptomyces sp. NBC_01264 TaxID=2903804 RepID=UPI00224FFB6B|nr:RICIN domain-containing protein [Streptomyces sp. NBC_01264]MCX4779058.1 RICIN domain-containing protein [Streptomyces sp. NBC_01264]